jgi:hypothetical protein
VDPVLEPESNPELEPEPNPEPEPELTRTKTGIHGDPREKIEHLHTCDVSTGTKLR